MTELVAAKLAKRVTEQQGRIRQLELAVQHKGASSASSCDIAGSAHVHEKRAAVLVQAAHSQQSILSAGSSGTQVGGEGGAGCISARACL